MKQIHHGQAFTAFNAVGYYYQYLFGRFKQKSAYGKGIDAGCPGRCKGTEQQKGK